MKQYTPRHRRHDRRTDREPTRRRPSHDGSAGWRNEYRLQAPALPDGGLTTLSGAGDREHDHDTGDDTRASDTPPATPILHDEDGQLVDPGGRRLYEVTEDTARLHHGATAAGWRHSCDFTPYENLRALVELVDADRRAYERIAFRFVLSFGPGSTPQALERLGVTA